VSSAERKSRLPRSWLLRVAARHTKNGSVTVEQLIEVKKLADSLGGSEQVRSALDALEQLR
jgi:alkylhydroperoxidase/carboxymuconolactone decarboxylase family protein YurZ